MTSTLGEGSPTDSVIKEQEGEDVKMALDERGTEVLCCRSQVLEKVTPIILLSHSSRSEVQLGRGNHCFSEGESLVSNITFHFTAQ